MRSVRRATWTSEEPVSFSWSRFPVMILLFVCRAIRRKPYAKRISSQCQMLGFPLWVDGDGGIVGGGDPVTRWGGG